jgi:hypothetical protein
MPELKKRALEALIVGIQVASLLTSRQFMSIATISVTGLIVGSSLTIFTG